MLEALIFILGIVVGSFLNVCIYRIPRGESIVFPGSKCGHCGEKIRKLDLVPIFSYIALKGKCRYCNAKFSVRYLLVELLTGSIFLAIFTTYGLSVSSAAFMFLACIFIVAAFIDLEYRIIPNRLVIAGLTVAIPVVVSGLHIEWTDALLGLAAGGGSLGVIGILSLLLLKKEGMGGGDIKLMGMAGLYLGLNLTLVSLIIAVYTAAIVVCVLFAVKKLKRGDHIPFGPFLSVGAIGAQLFGNEILYWYLRLVFAH